MSIARKIEGSRVIVFGGAGFIGSHVVDVLVDKYQCEVFVIDNLEVGKLFHVNPKATFCSTDIRLEAQLQDRIKDIQPHFVMNYAAHPYIPTCYKDPKKVFDVNASAAVSIIHYASKIGCIKAILQVSSAEVYGNNCLGDTGEDTTPYSPLSTYAAAKLAVDSYCKSVYLEKKVPVIILRQFNCIGARETHPYVLPEIISQLHKNRKSTLEKSKSEIYLGENTSRDFMDVRIAATEAVRLLSLGKFGEAYNLGSGKSITILDLVDLVRKIMELDEVTIYWGNPEKIRKAELWKLEANNQRLINLGYAPSTDLTSAIKYAYGYFVSSGYKWAWEK